MTWCWDGLFSNSSMPVSGALVHVFISMFISHGHYAYRSAASISSSLGTRNSISRAS
jgi:hypothetical protein